MLVCDHMILSLTTDVLIGFGVLILVFAWREVVGWIWKTNKVVTLAKQNQILLHKIQCSLGRLLD